MGKAYTRTTTRAKTETSTSTTSVTSAAGFDTTTPLRACVLENDIDFAGFTLGGKQKQFKNAAACANACLIISECFGFTYVKSVCYFKVSSEGRTHLDTAISGVCSQDNTEVTTKSTTTLAVSKVVTLAVDSSEENMETVEKSNTLDHYRTPTEIGNLGKLLFECNQQDQGLLVSKNSTAKKLAGTRPNILLAIADDLSHASAYGKHMNSLVDTPNFDRIAAAGILFDCAHTPNSKCAPSRAAIVTGRYPWLLEDAANNQAIFPSKFKSVVQSLEDNGYACGYTGKGWGPGSIEGNRNTLTGIEFNHHKVRGNQKAKLKVSNVDYTANFKSFLTITKLAQKMMQPKEQNQPWFFWYGGKEPHRAYYKGSGIEQTSSAKAQKTAFAKMLPSFWGENTNIASDVMDYAAEANYFDTHLGSILNVIDKELNSENTLIIATSDNAMPFPRYKGAPYEYATRMPMAIMWQGKLVRPGRRSSTPISFIDIAPLFLEVAGMSASKSGMQPMQGTSFTDVLEDASVRDKDCSIILTGRERNAACRKGTNDNYEGYPVRSILQGRFSYIVNFKPDRWPEGSPASSYGEHENSPTKDETVNAGTGNFVYDIIYGKRPSEELFDIVADPESVRNLATMPEYEAIKNLVKDRLFRELTVQRDPRILGNGDIFDKYPRAQ
jgi:arylsulfatase A-like enzyme